MEEPHDDPSQQHSDPKEKVEGEETECSCAEKQAAGNNKQPLHESGAK